MTTPSVCDAHSSDLAQSAGSRSESSSNSLRMSSIESFFFGSGLHHMNPFPEANESPRSASHGSPPQYGEVHIKIGKAAPPLGH